MLHADESCAMPRSLSEAHQQLVIIITTTPSSKYNVEASILRTHGCEQSNCYPSTGGRQVAMRWASNVVCILDLRVCAPLHRPHNSSSLNSHLCRPPLAPRHLLPLLRPVSLPHHKVGGCIGQVLAHNLSTWVSQPGQQPVQALRSNMVKRGQTGLHGGRAWSDMGASTCSACLGLEGLHSQPRNLS